MINNPFIDNRYANNSFYNPTRGFKGFYQKQTAAQTPEQQCLAQGGRWDPVNKVCMLSQDDKQAYQDDGFVTSDSTPASVTIGDVTDYTWTGGEPSGNNYGIDQTSSFLYGPETTQSGSSTPYNPATGVGYDPVQVGQSVAGGRGPIQPVVWTGEDIDVTNARQEAIKANIAEQIFSLVPVVGSLAEAAGIVGANLQGNGKGLLENVVDEIKRGIRKANSSFSQHANSKKYEQAYDAYFNNLTAEEAAAASADATGEWAKLAGMKANPSDPAAWHKYIQALSDASRKATAAAKAAAKKKKKGSSGGGSGGSSGGGSGGSSGGGSGGSSGKGSGEGGKDHSGPSHAEILASINNNAVKTGISGAGLASDGAGGFDPVGDEDENTGGLVGDGYNMGGRVGFGQRAFNAGGPVGQAPQRPMSRMNEGGPMANHPFDREGEHFDTVDAKLTPGEFVIDADSTHVFQPILEKINEWEPGDSPKLGGLLSKKGEKMTITKDLGNGRKMSVTSGEDDEMLVDDAEKMLSTETKPVIRANAGQLISGLLGQSQQNQQANRLKQAAAQQQRAGLLGGGLQALGAGADNQSARAGSAGLNTNSTGSWGSGGYNAASFSGKDMPATNYGAQTKAISEGVSNAADAAMDLAKQLNKLEDSTSGGSGNIKDHFTTWLGIDEDKPEQKNEGGMAGYESIAFEDYLEEVGAGPNGQATAAAIRAVAEELYNGAEDDATEASWIKDLLSSDSELEQYMMQAGAPEGADLQEVKRSLQYRFEVLKEAYDEEYGNGGSSYEVDNSKEAEIRNMGIELAKQGVNYDDAVLQIIRKVYPQGVTDAMGMQVEELISGYFGAQPAGPFGQIDRKEEASINDKMFDYEFGGMKPTGFNTGGYAEGDSLTHRGQTVYFKNGKWQYASGAPAPDYVVTHINSLQKGGKDVAQQNVDEGHKILELKEGESKNAGWARRAMNAEATIRELYAKGYNPASFARSKQEFIAGLLGNNDIFRDENGQRYRRAVEAFIAAVLRKDTGAQIASSEFERVATEMFPNFGTGKVAQDDLGDQRDTAIKSFIEAAGPAAPELMKEYENLQDFSTDNQSGILTATDAGATAGASAGAYGGLRGAKKLKGGKLGLLTSAGAALAGAGAGSVTGGGAANVAQGKPFATEADLINAVNTAVTGAGLLVGSSKSKEVAIAVKNYLKSKGLTAADVGQSAVEDIASKLKSKAASQVAGKVPDEIAAKYAHAQPWTYKGEPYFIDGNKVINGVSGKPVKGKKASEILEEADKHYSELFNTGGRVKGLLRR